MGLCCKMEDFSDYKTRTLHQDSRGACRLRKFKGSDSSGARATEDGESAEGAAQHRTESHARRSVGM